MAKGFFRVIFVLILVGVSWGKSLRKHHHHHQHKNLGEMREENSVEVAGNFPNFRGGSEEVSRRYLDLFLDSYFEENLGAKVDKELKSLRRGERREWGKKTTKGESREEELMEGMQSDQPSEGDYEEGMNNDHAPLTTSFLSLIPIMNLTRNENYSDADYLRTMRNRYDIYFSN